MMDIKVMLTAAFKEAYLELVPALERATGNKVASAWVSSVDMMTRLKAGEVVDLAICSVKAADELAAAGIVGERTSIAKAGVAAAVRAGATHDRAEHPDAAKALVKHFGAAEAAPIIRCKGMEPA